MATRFHLLIAATMAAAAIVAIVPTPNVSAAPNEQSAAITHLFDYLRNHNSTGFLVIQDGKVLLEKSWPAPEGDRRDPLFAGPAFAI